ncbi:MAG: VOC family protein [Gammaproteobacteria bacterium]|jgi:predicted enzyme related to lactoylglutathione lyase|nr:VOC family protein [Gammaproteobacteria bacterium]MDG2337955.1 VOC family protein [Gammaproteobacteria bacterium]
MNDEAEDLEAPPEPTEEAKPSKIGRIEWMDLTVPNAEQVRNFYTSVVGWTSSEVDMGSYNDFNINLPDTQDTIAGVCHSQHSNANIPSQWLVYVRVESVADSAAICEKQGGEVLDGPRRMGGSYFCVIKDPAGAVMALLSD